MIALFCYRGDISSAGARAGDISIVGAGDPLLGLPQGQVRGRGGLQLRPGGVAQPAQRGHGGRGSQPPALLHHRDQDAVKRLHVPSQVQCTVYILSDNIYNIYQ